MHLAENSDLTFEQVQLLANCSQPVFVLDISSTAKGLIQRGLVLPFLAVCPHSNRECFLLAASDQGRRYVEEWIRRHERDASDSVGDHASTDQTRFAVA